MMDIMPMIVERRSKVTLILTQKQLLKVCLIYLSNTVLAPRIYLQFFSQTTFNFFKGNPNEAPYSPVPILGNKSLDTFGLSIVKIIYPQIEDRLSIIYGNRMQNADAAVVFAIQQSALSPGSPNVIGSGQKLAPNRPLNEVLMGVGEDVKEGFPVLVVKGLDDRVSSPEAAKNRAELFSKLNPETVCVETIEDAGHCPHDDAPDKVAHAMLKWFASSLQDTTVTPAVRTGRGKDAMSVTE